MNNISENDVVSALFAETGKVKDAIVMFASPDMVYVRFKNVDRRHDKWISKNEAIIKKKAAKSSRFSEVEVMRNLDTIQYGPWLINCWYYSPYDAMFTIERHLYVCDCCLEYFSNKKNFVEHGHSPENLRPPGKEIYRHGPLSMFLCDGSNNKFFCQNLSLLSKLFLDDQRAFYDVDRFFFFVLCECDDLGAHVVGYFSREKRWLNNNIIACFVVFPPFQRQGYGELMIRIAYEIARRSDIIGSPEKPLSDMGKKAFESYWKTAIIETVHLYRSVVTSIDIISMITAISKVDLIHVMRDMELIKKNGNDWTSELNMRRLEKLSKAPLEKIPKHIFYPKDLIWTPIDNG